MNWGSWMLWGFVSTLVMTTIEAGAQELGLTRVDFPFLVGMMFTPDRDRAKMYGFLVHVLNGWGVSLIYILIFQSLGAANWWCGAIVGLCHAAFVLLVVLWILPGVHPRMASEQHGPTAMKQLEPPGILGLNYGFRTPIAVVLSHVIFGIMLGSFYHLAPK